MGLNDQSIVGCFPELHKQFINNFVFPTWGCAANSKSNNNNNI